MKSSERMKRRKRSRCEKFTAVEYPTIVVIRCLDISTSPNSTLPFLTDPLVMVIPLVQADAAAAAGPANPKVTEEELDPAVCARFFYPSFICSVLFPLMKFCG